MARVLSIVVGSSVAIVGAVLGVTPAAVAAPERPHAQLLITATAGAPVPAPATGVARIGGLRFLTVTVPRGRSARGYADALTHRPGIIAAQPNTPIRRAAIAGTCVDTPTAPLLGVVTAANARSRPLPATTRPIAVLDTGVDPAVPELAGRVLPVSNAITGAPPAAADDDGHGTQVAAAAAGAPGLVAGISPTSPIMPIRIATASVLATPATIVKGLEIAVERKARVAVLPSSQPLSQVSSATVTSVGLATSAAFADGVITVVPAGNEGANDPIFPGGLAHVLTAGSAATTAGRDDFSNTGPWIDLVAPGGDLVLPAPPSICIGGYARGSGTSFSAAAVAGAVALIGAARPSLTTAGLYDLVRRRATTNAGTSGFDVNTGFGLLDVGDGLTAPASIADPFEVNDNVYWLKRRPAAFPTYLRKLRKATIRDSVSPGKDPQDAFKVYLRRGDLLRASVSNQSSSSVLYASIWSRATGPFDMRLPAPSSELRDSGGFTQNPLVSFRASLSGTYYVAVFAPEWTVPGEQGTVGKDLAPLSTPRTPYALRLARTR